MLNNVTIIWDYNNKQLFNSYVKAASYITYLNYYIEILPLAPSIESFRNLVTITKLFVIHKQLQLQFDATPFQNPQKNAVVQIILPQFPFSRTSFWAKSKFLMNVKKTFINQKLFGLHSYAAPFWNPKQSADICNNAVGHIVQPEFTFKV